MSSDRKDFDRSSVSKGAEPAEQTHVETFDPAIAKRVARKYDVRLLGLLAAMYLCNALDKTNLGNAKTAGLDKDIGLKGDEYYNLITAFYAPFCTFGVPITILIKKFSAARVLPVMALAFGTLSMCTAAVKNFGGLLTIRMLLAVSEAACLPGVVYYLSSFYTRAELASRVGIFYAASSIAGAFGGLIAYGVFHITDTRLFPWQYLFLVEGAVTVCVAVLMWLLLPTDVAHARFLTPEERRVGELRLLQDATSELNSKLDVSGAFSALARHWPTTLAWFFIELCLGVPLASVSNFLPQIVARLGYSTVRTNLLTVAPNIVGALCLVAITQSSDRQRERSAHLVLPLALTFAGFIVLFAVDPLTAKGVSYFGCFLLASGSFTPSVLLVSWAANNTLDESQRAVLVSLTVAFGNAAGLVSSNVFQAKDEPKYLPALICSAAFGAAAILGVVALGLYMRLDNARRDRAQGVKMRSGDVDTAGLRGGMEDASFRWMY